MYVKYVDHLYSGIWTTYTLGYRTWETDNSILLDTGHGKQTTLSFWIQDMGNGQLYPLVYRTWETDNSILFDTGHGKRTTLSSWIQDMGNGQLYALGYRTWETEKSIIWEPDHLSSGICSQGK